MEVNEDCLYNGTAVQNVIYKKRAGRVGLGAA